MPPTNPRGPLSAVPVFVILLALLGAGCTFIKTSRDIGGEMPDLVDEEEGDQAEEPETGLLSAPDAIAAVQRHLARADRFIQQGDPARARVQYQKAFLLLLGRVKEDGRAEYQAQLEQSMLQVTTAYTRFARTQGVMLPREQRGGDLAIEFHPRVERWVNYYLTTGRGSMVRYLERSGAYFPMIEDVLAEKGLPEDLKYLPIIESGFSPYAYSPAAASGLWQFIPSTGRRFGMQIDDWVDERRDPMKATYAAAAYLTFLYDMFDDWALSLAAYNCGEACVSRAIANGGTHNYWDLALPAETMDYVPKFVAAATIARDPESYGFSVQPDPPIQVKRVALGGVADLRSLAAKTGLDYDQIKLFNPELKGSSTPPNQVHYDLNVPLVNAEPFEQSLASLGASAYLSADEVKKLTAPRPTVSRSKLVYYKVKKGDSLGTIARRYKTTVASIKRLNRLKGTTIRAGQKLKVQPGAKK